MYCHWSFLLLTLFITCSYQRSVDEWSTITDQSFIDECLQIVLTRLKSSSQEKVTNVVCQTKIFNGMKIKLFFNLDQQRWACSLYKSTVQTLGIQYRECNTIDQIDENPQQSKDAAAAPVPEEENDDEEAKIDELNRGMQQEQNENENNQQNNNRVEEQDDEESVNTKNEDETEQKGNNEEKTEQKENDDEETEQKGAENEQEETNNQQAPERNNNEQEQ